MKKALEEAIGQLRELPEEEQDAAADAVLAYVANDARQGDPEETEAALTQSW